MPPQTLSIHCMQPSQLFISAEKLKQVQQWFDPHDLRFFPPIPIKVLDGLLVMTDGHTRAVAALMAGNTELPIVWETEELDWEMYQACVAACLEQGITSPAALTARIVSASEYQEKWDGWCDRMQEEIRAQRVEAGRRHSG